MNQSSSSRNKNDEEAETKFFSWNVAEIMKDISGKRNHQNDFSKNPGAVHLMASHYLSSSQYYTSFYPFRLNEIINTNNNKEKYMDYNDLLRIQNSTWGKQKISIGIIAAREGKYESAIEFCNAALSFLPDSVEAYVCRGASNANIENYEKAKSDFERALELDPSDHNARDYLNKINEQMRPINAMAPPIQSVVDSNITERPFGSSKVKIPITNRSLILISNVNSSSSSSSSRDIPAVVTINGYTFEKEEDKERKGMSSVRSKRDNSNSSIDSDSSRSRSKSTKKRKIEKEEKHKKSKKSKKKKSKHQGRDK